MKRSRFTDQRIAYALRHPPMTRRQNRIKEVKLEPRAMALRERGEWATERRFFDRLAAAQATLDLDLIARRYEAAAHCPLYRLEFAYSMLGDIRGKRILDVGCGLGENALLFGRWGAQVTGVDISPASIDVCNKRARAWSLSEQVSFFTMPFETFATGNSRYDVVWSVNFLHHVLDRLDQVADVLSNCLAPRGFVIFSEPVRLSPALKLLRALVPAQTAGTPDEHPLQRADLVKLESRFEFSAERLYGPVSRIVDRIVLNEPYEAAGSGRRAVADFLCRFDRRLMSIHALRGAAMVLVARLTPR